MRVRRDETKWRRGREGTNDPELEGASLGAERERDRERERQGEEGEKGGVGGKRV